MKKIILSILTITVLVITLTIFWVIHSFNAENYKQQVIKTLQNMTGRSVQVDGEVSLAWKPLPTFIMNRLTISNEKESSVPLMATIEQVQVEIEWTSFFKNPLVIKRILLKKPDILLERHYSYQTNFFFPVLFNPNRNMEQDVVFSSSLFNTSIDTLDIESGTLKWKNVLTSEDIVFKEINGTGRVDNLDGPYSFKGKFQFDNQKFNIDIKTNQLLIASPFKITISLDESESQTNFNMVATLNFDEKEPKWLDVAGAYTSQKPALFFKQIGMTNWNSEGILSGSYKMEAFPKQKQIQLKDIIFSQKQDDNTILSAKLNLTQEASGKKLLSLMADVVDLKQFNPQFLSYLSHNSMDIDVQILKAVWGKIILAPLSLKGTSAQGILSAKMSATIPNADKTQNGAVSFNGTYNFSKKLLQGEISANLSDALAWFHDVFDKNYLPQSGAKSLNLVGKVEMTPLNQSTEIQVGSLDKIQFTGKINHSSENWQTDLTVKDLNLDDYYTLPDDFFDIIYQQILGTSDHPLEGTVVPTIWNIEISDLTLKHLLFPLVRVKGTVKKGTLDFSDIVLKMSDKDMLSLSGVIHHPGTTDISYDKGSVHFVTENVKKWSFFGKNWDFILQKGFEKLKSSFVYSGNLQQGDLKFSFASQGYELATEGQVQNILNNPELYANKVHFVCPNFSQMMKLISPETHLFESIPVAFDFEGVLTKSVDSVLCQQGTLKIGKDKADFSGKYDQKENHLSLDIQSESLNLTLLSDLLSRYFENMNQPFNLSISTDFSMDFLIQAKQWKIYESLYNNLKAQGILSNQQLDLKELSFFGKTKNATFNLTGLLSFKNGIAFDGHLKTIQIPMSDEIFKWDDYSLGYGEFSVDTDLKSHGNNLQSIWNTLQFTAPFEWAGAIIKGVNLAAVKKTTLNTLEMTEIPNDFARRLNQDFQNGHTPLPTIKGKMKMAQGQLSLLNIQGSNELLDVSDMTLDIFGLGQRAQLKIPFVLKMVQSLPAIIFELSETQVKIENANFIGALTDKVKILSSQNFEKKQQKMKQEKEQRNAKMQNSAEQILSQTETLLKVLQEKVSLNPSPQANEKMTQLTKGVQEIRRLAVKSNLTDAEYTSLLSKTKMLAAQAKDFNNWFGVSDFMNRKKMTLLQAEESDRLLNKMEKIYQQNARSVLMAEIIVNARSVIQGIHQDAEKLQASKEKNEMLEIMNRMDDNRLKLQKAYDFMNKQNGTQKE